MKNLTAPKTSAIKYEPLKLALKQTLAFKYLLHPDYDRLKYLGYGGAGFGGKSALATCYLIHMCMTYPEIHMGLCRNELKKLKDTTLLVFFEMAKRMQVINEVDFKYSEKNSRVTFANGSIIFLIQLKFLPSDPLYTYLGGYYLTAAVIDESAEIHEKGVSTLISRCGRHLNSYYNIPTKILETFNPDTGHVYRRYWLPYKEKRETDEIKFIPALPKDNPSPDVQNYIDGIVASGDQILYQRMVKGNFDFVNDPYLLINPLKMRDIWTNDFVKPGEYFITADVAGMGSDLMVWCVWSGFQVVEVRTLEKNDGKKGREIFEELRYKYGVTYSNIVFDADGIGGALIGDLPGAYSFINNSKPLKDYEENDGNRENFQHLKAQCYFKFANYINKGKIWIRDKKYLPGIEEDLKHVRRMPKEEDGTLKIEKKDATKESLGRSPDFYDALMMRMYFTLELRPQFGHSSIH